MSDFNETAEVTTDTVEETITVEPEKDFIEEGRGFEHLYEDSMARKQVVYSSIEDGSSSSIKLNDEETIKQIEREEALAAKKKEKKNGLFSKLPGFGKKEKSETTKGSKKTKINTTVQKTIPYRNVYLNGIIEVEEGLFTKSYYIGDVNFKIAPTQDQENIFSLYGDLLNQFDSECSISVTIYNRNLNESKFNRDTLIPYESDGLNEYRDEFNNMLISKVAEGKNNLVHEKYFNVAIPSDNIETAVKEFSRIDSLVSRAIKAINKQETKPLSTQERLNILYSIYNLDSEVPFMEERYINGRKVKSFDLKDLQAQGLTSKDAIAPSSFEFKSNYFKVGGTYARSLYIAGYPSFVNTDFIPDLSDTPCNMLITMHYKSMRQDQAIKLIRNQSTNIGSNVVAAQKNASRGGYSTDLISPDLQKAQEEARKLMDDVTTRNQKLFFLTFSLTHFAKSKDELNKDTKVLQDTAQRKLITLKPLVYQQEPGFNSSLPLGLNQLKISRLNTTESASVFMPFSVQEWTEKKGFYYGVNAISRNMILYNRKKGANFNGMILGVPGAGKSFSAKTSIIQAILNTQDDVYVIDPEREYIKLADAFSPVSNVVKIAAGSNVYVNPLDLDIDSGEDNTDPITIKSDFICSLCEIVAGGSYGLSPTQESIIDRCVRAVYQPYLEVMRERQAKNPNDTIDKSICPTLDDLYELLIVQVEPEAEQLALALERYIKGSLNIFAHRTNIETSGRFIIFDIKDIGSGMMEFGLQVALDAIWNQMVANKKKGKYTWIFIDEMHILCQRDSSAKYLQSIYKRARKWGGIPTGITQNVEDVLQSKYVRSVINTSNFVLMLSQAPMDRDELAAMFNMSDEEKAYITNADPGHGLIFNSKALIPFEDSFPQDTKLYEIMTTRLADTNGDTNEEMNSAIEEELKKEEL